MLVFAKLSSAFIGAQFLDKRKNWRTSQSDTVTCPADKWTFFLISIPAKRLIAPGNMCITVLGEFDSVLTVGSRKHTERLYVVDRTNALLGREACVKLGLITM